MKVAVLRETHPNETRVGLVPDGVKFLKKKEIDVVVEKGAGQRAGFLDEQYEAEGALVAADAASAVAQSAMADVVGVVVLVGVAIDGEGETVSGTPPQETQASTSAPT